MTLIPILGSEGSANDGRGTSREIVGSSRLSFRPLTLIPIVGSEGSANDGRGISIDIVGSSKLQAIDFLCYGIVRMIDDAPGCVATGMGAVEPDPAGQVVTKEGIISLFRA